MLPREITMDIENRTLSDYACRSSDSKGRDIFDSMYLVFTWLYGWCFICLWVLLNPFVGGIWIAKEWMLSENVVFLVSLNFLLNGMIFAPMKFIQAAGLYWQAKWRYVISAVLNISLSLLFSVGFHWGLEGILFATALSMIGMTAMDPYVVFRHLFHENAAPFYCKHIAAFVGIILTGYLTGVVCNNLLSAYTLGNFILRMLVCTILPNALWLAVLFRTKVFRGTAELLWTYARAIVKNKKGGAADE